MPSASSDYHDILETHRTKLVRIAEQRGVRRLKQLYDRAQDELVGKLRRAVPGSRTTFTAYQQRALLAQVQQGQAVISQHLAGELGELSREAQVESLRGLSTWLSRMEKHYGGGEVTLPIDEAARFWGVVDKRRTSLMKQHATSMANYGAHLVGKMEEQLGLALATGEDVAGAIDRIQKVADVEWWKGEQIARCLPGETRITAAVVGAVHRRWYEGPMVEIVGESGCNLTATPNHPVLTRRGWVQQGLVVPGDYLIRDRRNQETRTPRSQHVADGPPSIAQIFDAVQAVGVCERRRGAQPDFHGDGGDGNVDIARPYRELMYGIFAALSKPSSEKFFAPPDVGSLRDRFCSLCLRLLPHERACFCQRANANARFTQSSGDDTVIDIERGSDFWAAFPALVSAPKFIERQFDLVRDSITCKSNGLRIGHRTNDSSLGEMSLYAMAADSEALANLSSAQTADVEFDRVVDVRIREFSSHVFNLTTPHGYFAAHGYFVGNTELAWSTNATHADGIAEVASEIDDMYMRWVEHVTDRGTPMDDRVGADSLVMHGQVARPSDFFEMPRDPRVSQELWGQVWPFPPNRPNDRAVLAAWRPHWGGYAYRLVGGRRVPMRATK